MGAAWTDEEREALRRHYPKHRSGKWGGWKRVLPNRSPTSIMRQAVKLGLTKKKRTNRPWSDEETAELLRFAIDFTRRHDRTPVAIAMHLEWLCQRAKALNEAAGKGLRP